VVVHIALPPDTVRVIAIYQLIAIHQMELVMIQIQDLLHSANVLELVEVALVMIVMLDFLMKIVPLHVNVIWKMEIYVPMVLTVPVHVLALQTGPDQVVLLQ
jgi:hypothetical protein